MQNLVKDVQVIQKNHSIQKTVNGTRHVLEIRRKDKKPIYLVRNTATN